MSIGSMVCWNFGDQPGADMSWQSWAANELNQAAKYPSPYANVHKGNICTMGGSIGFSDNDTLKSFTSEKRKSHHPWVEEMKMTLMSVNVTTWTVGYAIPYHANLLFQLY
ncbi:unnamed protein product [Porites lobata]|uniref:Uncharacterized protein n=1 Tax=Porites lobata TaxID=104759 RepID=A0ABN8N8A4_9CNID|nr:unnamed protein product [Porites lobata]